MSESEERIPQIRRSLRIGCRDEAPETKILFRAPEAESGFLSTRGMLDRCSLAPREARTDNQM